MKKSKVVKNSTLSTIFWIVVSLVAAVLIWVYVTETVGEDITLPFPGVEVVYEGESQIRENRELIVSDNSTTSVTVNITGNRRTLTALKSSDLKAVIDLSRITRTGNYQLSPEITFPTKTDTSAITSVSTSPDSVSFFVDKLDKKTIDVRGVFNGSAAEGYSADPLVISPSTIIVYGPSSVLSNVKTAYIEVSRTDVDRTQTFESTYVLLDEDNNEFESDELTFSDETVSVTLPIRAVKEITLKVKLNSGGGATEDNAVYKLDPQTITLIGDAETLNGLNNITVATIELAEVDGTLTETYRIDIPDNTELFSGRREATLTLELRGLFTKTFHIDKDNITCINVSEGFKAEVQDDRLWDVVIRGAEEEVNGLSAAQIRAVVDLTNYGSATGAHTVPAQIFINGATGAGAIGEYSVHVYISEDIPEEETEP